MPRIRIKKKMIKEKEIADKGGTYSDPSFFTQEEVDTEELLAKQYKKEKEIRISKEDGIKVQVPKKKEQGVNRRSFSIKCEHPDCFYRGAELDAKTNFYKTLSSTDGYYHICRKCIDKMMQEDFDNGNLDNLHKILKEMNIAFNRPLWENALAECVKDGKLTKRVFSKYYNKITTGAFKDLAFSDDQFNMDEKELQEELEMFEPPKEKEPTGKKAKTVTEMKKFWGAFSKEELESMQSKFDTIMEETPNASNQRIDLIKTAVIYRVKEEMAVVNDAPLDVIKKWGDLANKAYTNAKLNTSQIEEDLNNVSSFSEMARKLEEVYNVVHILPEFRYRPNDAVDFVLWELINYVRGLRGMKDCRYEEIWQYYDTKKQEYIRDTGDPFKIFEADPTKMNRNLVQRFLKGTYEKSDD